LKTFVVGHDYIFAIFEVKAQVKGAAIKEFGISLQTLSKYLSGRHLTTTLDIQVSVAVLRSVADTHSVMCGTVLTHFAAPMFRADDLGLGIVASIFLC